MTDFPEYDLPTGVGTEATQGDTQVSATPTDQTAASGPGSDTPAPDHGQPTMPGGVPDQIPRYRLDEVSQALREERAERQRLQAQMGELLQRLTTPQAPPQTQEEEEELDERQQKILGELERLLKRTTLYRELAPLMARSKDVIGVVQTAEQRAEAEKARWNQVAYNTTYQVLDQAAKTLIGPDATPDRLTPIQARWLSTGFYDFVQSDPRLVQRYEAQDASLIAEFLTQYRGAFAAVPAPQRAAAAAQQRRVEATRRLPTQGPAGGPVGQAPQKLDYSNEDAVLAEGWRQLKEMQGAGR